MNDFRNEKRRQDAIGRRLRKMYDDVVNEGDTPEEFLDILRGASPSRSDDGKSDPKSRPDPGKKD